MPESAQAASDADSNGEPIFTPPDSEIKFPSAEHPEASTIVRRASPSPLRTSSLPPKISDQSSAEHQTHRTGWSEAAKGQENNTESNSDSDSDLGLDEEEMVSNGPTQRRPVDETSEQPLLKEEVRGRSDHETPHGSARSPFVSQRHTFRSRSPAYVDAKSATRTKYIYASFFLGVCLVSFVVQTETAVYIQRTLGWKKAYCMLWLTHGSWSLLWPAQLLILRIQKRKLSWQTFWRRHKAQLKTTAQMIQQQELHLTTSATHVSPISYILRTTVLVASALTVAGVSWYVAVDLTTPSDLTAIYNCSAFFAYVFSIMLLHDKLRLDKGLAVIIAIVGVLVVVYGDSKDTKAAGPHGGAAHGAPQQGGGDDDSGGGIDDDSTDSAAAEGVSRTVGNLVIGLGSVLYGLYEVLYKKWACPPEGTSPGRGMVFANFFGSLIGLFTLSVLWIPLPILHITGIEPFELPRGQAAGLLFISTVSNAVFSGAFLVLMSLTSPVLGSVAALLTIFLVAITDSWLYPDSKLSAAAIGGGSLIVFAFFMLSWATYREMEQERKKTEEEEANGGGVVSDDEDA